MVEILLHNRLGNRLCQYAYGRVLAEQMGYAMRSEPIEGFPGTQQKVEGRDYSDSRFPVQTVGYFQSLVDTVIADPTPRKIIVNGYFENWRNFLPYRDRIRTWLSPAPVTLPFAIGTNDLVVHVRRGDFLYYDSLLPFSYYEEAIQRAKPNKIYLCSDDYRDPFLKNFARFSPVYVELDVLQEFYFMTLAPKIVTSQSTFSWWAAFLSQATEIYLPIPRNGFWDPERFAYRDLIVTGDRTFLPLRCRERYRKTLQECWKFFIWKAFINNVLLIKMVELFRKAKRWRQPRTKAVRQK